MEEPRSAVPPSTPRATPHNLGLYRLEGFSGRRAELLQLREWLIGDDDLPAIAISGEQGIGKSALATAAAWNNFYHFEDGIVRVGAAGATRFRLYDIVRTLDTVFGTTLTRISEERWGISILEQLYRRKRLLILDELSGATQDDLATLVDIIGHLHEAGGNSRVMFIDRNFSPSIAELVRFQHIHLEGIARDDLPQLIEQRAPEAAREEALAHANGLYDLAQGKPYTLRLLFGLLMDYSWTELSGLFRSTTNGAGQTPTDEIVSFSVESCAAFQPQTGPLLDRLVSASGGASFAALRDLFWADLGTPAELEETVASLLQRALLDRDMYQQRVVMHPLVRRYMAQNVVMLGEEWDRRHAQYYVGPVEQYQYFPLERWSEIDVEWGNVYRGADWCAERIQRLLQQPPLDILSTPEVDHTGLSLTEGIDAFADDLRLARAYGLALAHYAFWRHPPGIQRWLATGAVASLALADTRNYAWLLLSIGRHYFFHGEVGDATRWLKRAADIFDQRDLLGELAYALTDLGTSYRIIDRSRQALPYFHAAFECVAQLGDVQGIATAHMNLGSAHYGLEDHQRALQEYRKALRIALRLQNDQQSASVFNSMGLAMEGMERLAEAQQAYERALELFRRIDDITGISTCYNNLGSVSYALGNFQQALMWYELDLGLSERLGAWTDMAATLHNLGHVALELGETERSLAYFMQSRDLYAAFDLMDYVREEEEMIESLRTEELARAR